MDNKYFKAFMVEMEFLYLNEKGNDKIESAFERLLRIKTLDGVKKVYTRDGETRAKLTSKDNSLLLMLTKKSLRVSYSNLKLATVQPATYKQLKDLLLETNDLLQKPAIELARSRQFFYSLKDSDKKHLIHELITYKYIDRLDSFEISFDFPEKSKTTLTDLTSVNVSNQHTPQMHKAFESLGKVDDLEKLVTVYAASFSIKDPDESQASLYLDEAITFHQSFAILERLGYGQQ